MARISNRSGQSGGWNWPDAVAPIKEEESEVLLSVQTTGGIGGRAFFQDGGGGGGIPGGGGDDDWRAPLDLINPKWSLDGLMNPRPDKVVCGPEATDWFLLEVKNWLSFSRDLLQVLKNRAYQLAVANFKQRWPQREPVIYDRHIDRALRGQYERTGDGLNVGDMRLGLMLWLGPTMLYDTVFTSASLQCAINCMNTETLTVIDTCLHRSEVGNFLFGAAGEELGIGPKDLFRGFMYFNKGKPKIQDWAAYVCGEIWLRNVKRRQIPNRYNRDVFEREVKRITSLVPPDVMKGVSGPKKLWDLMGQPCRVCSEDESEVPIPIYNTTFPREIPVSAMHVDSTKTIKYIFKLPILRLHKMPQLRPVVKAHVVGD